MGVVDQRLLGHNPSVEVITSIRLFSELALACLREKKGERPSMKAVVQELQRIIKIVDKEEVFSEVEIMQSKTLIMSCGRIQKLK
ncbi:hypothetical protein CK203_109345 [Vitis vinifera]|uniref:Uncharacterized protein n=1 Tax=Vitis vinifera TaxID=29760 RepID=A0A438EK58_VITVI|nr:hypothetical protein CK203_109345 [Vitis vinifera]